MIKDQEQKLSLIIEKLTQVAETSLLGEAISSSLKNCESPQHFKSLVHILKEGIQTAPESMKKTLGPEVYELIISF